MLKHVVHKLKKYMFNFIIYTFFGHFMLIWKANKIQGLIMDNTLIDNVCN